LFIFHLFISVLFSHVNIPFINTVRILCYFICILTIKMYTYTHTDIHTCIHTYTYIHIYLFIIYIIHTLPMSRHLCKYSVFYVSIEDSV